MIKFLFAFFFLIISPSFSLEEGGKTVNDSSFTESEKEPIDLSELQSTQASYESAIYKIVFVLLTLILLSALAFYLFKKFASSRMQQANHFRNIKILEKRAISPKSMLYLVEVGGKKMLIGESQLELRSLSSLDWIEPEKKGL